MTKKFDWPLALVLAVLCALAYLGLTQVALPIVIHNMALT